MFTISFYFKSVRCDYFQCCGQFELFQAKILMKDLTWFTALLVFIFTVPINEDFHDIHHWKEGDYSYSSPYKKRETEGTMTQLTAFVLGATGEVGREVVNALAAHEAFSKIVIIGRRKLELNGEKFKKFDNSVVDFEKLEEYADKFQGFDAGFCCLGTTRGKAGADGFVKVDHDYVVGSAKLALKGGTKQFHLVSSTGANKNSMFLYPKTKGQVEEEISQMGFERTSIYRPGLLLCDRQESRPMEKVAQVVASSLDRWGKFSIPTVTVAQAMVKNALRSPQKSVEIIDHAQLFHLAKS